MEILDGPDMDRKKVFFVYLHNDLNHNTMNRLTIFLLLTLPILFACTQKEQEVQEIRVESVTLSQSSAEIEIGKTLQLNATVSPSMATRKDITWSSSKSSVASVSSSGLVTAVSEGTTTITASADGKKGECTVTVVKKAIVVSEVRLDKTELTLFEGDEETLTASVSPEDATDKTITWTSSDKSIASVESGKVKAVGKGSAKITASAGGKSASCTIEVLRPVSGISLNKSTLELPLEKSETLIATVIPSDATLREEITWTSSNTQVANVDGGKVTAVGMGTATISASLEGFKAECNVTVKGMEYGKVAITDLQPEEIMPIIGQVEAGDKDFYKYMDHLRVVETTRLSDMMWEYGAGYYTIEEYRTLMGRLNVMMVNEIPTYYDNYEVIGQLYNETPSGHAFIEWFVLNTLIKHANFKVIVWDFSLFKEYSNNHPDSFNILANSTGATYKVPGPYADLREQDRDRYYDEGWFLEKNILFFEACANRMDWGEGYFDKICQMDADSPDDKSCYQRQASNANGKNDPIADRHHIITIATDCTGDVDLTNEIGESSCFPIGFHDDVLFAGRQFLYKKNKDDKIRATNGPWANSFCNYFNAAMASLCFQIKADMKDVDELLDMLRSTSLTDFIRQDGMSQRLHLMNPAGLYKKYLTPQNLPASISSRETIPLDKGYYKGVLFSIPGAEVKVNGEWIAFDNKNRENILSQNPMNLEWRLNGDLLKKYGYTSGQTVEGQIITVDDNWGGLRLEVPMTIQVR